MQNSSSQKIDQSVFPYQTNIDYRYVAKLEIEAHILRAQAISNAVSAISSDIAKLFSGTVNWFAKNIERSRQRNELYALSDHLLWDIGILRSEIDGIVNGTIELDHRQPVPASIDSLEQPKAAAKVQNQQDDMSIAA